MLQEKPEQKLDQKENNKKKVLNLKKNKKQTGT